MKSFSPSTEADATTPALAVSETLSLSGRMWWGFAALLVVALLLPLATVEIPPLLDYPNHLARMFVLAHGAADGFLSQVYAQHWSIIPNIAIDAVMPPLLSVLPLYVAGKLLLAASLLLPVAGCVVYSRASFGHCSPWPLASGLLAYNSLFLLGFMNFEIGIGCALLAAAGWIALRRGPIWRVVAVLAPVAVGLFFVHLFALALFALLCGLHELVPLAARCRLRQPVMRLALRAAAVLAAVIAVPALLYRMSELADTPGHAVWSGPAFKLLQLFGAFTQYDALGGMLLSLVLLGLMALLWTRGHAQVAPAALLAGMLLICLYLFVPFGLKDTAFIDSRLPVMAGFMLFAGFVPFGLPRHLGIGLSGALGVLLLLRMAAVAQIWQGQTADLSQLRQAIAPVPPGSRVLVAALDPRDNPVYWRAMPPQRRTVGGALASMHFAALLVIERDSMWPLLFTQTSKQPLEVTPAYRSLTVGAGVPPRPGELAAGLATADAPYLADWANRFDYVLVLLAGGAGDLASLAPTAIGAGRLEPVVQTDFAALLRIKPAAGAR